jgi:hypothetical protein
MTRPHLKWKQHARQRRADRSSRLTKPLTARRLPPRVSRVRSPSCSASSLLPGAAGPRRTGRPAPRPRAPLGVGSSSSSATSLPQSSYLALALASRILFLASASGSIGLLGPPASPNDSVEETGSATPAESHRREQVYYWPVLCRHATQPNSACAATPTPTVATSATAQTAAARRAGAGAPLGRPYIGTTIRR